MSSLMRLFQHLFLTLLVGVGTTVGLVMALSVLGALLPAGVLCDAFGGSFEGNCGYVQLLLAVVLGLMAAMKFLTRRLSRKNSVETTTDASMPHEKPPYQV